MAEPLESFKRYIGKSKTATDVVTASAILKFAATLGLEDPPMEKGAPIPPGWHGGFPPFLSSCCRCPSFPDPFMGLVSPFLPGSFPEALIPTEPGKLWFGL